ncbi:MAG: pilus assembly protein PilY, partial [Caldimonas sp.]
MKPDSATPRRLAALLLSAPLAALAAPPFALSTYPLFLAPAVKPNVMVILDNSESMDATMSGKVINGDDVNTRGNIARGILRGLLTSYRDSFNFGITSFRTRSVSLYNTHAYYLGDATTMVYTNDCVAGISLSNAGRRCIANPQTGNGFLYITYQRSGDDADINDVLYSGATDNQLYGIGTSGTSYNVYRSHDNSVGWAAGNFSGGYGTWNFTPTDAGFLPTVAATPRQLWIKRGWGYGDDITGAGHINEAVRADSSAHFTTMMTLLGSETNRATGEIKNNAFYTPIAGTLSTVKDYFRGGSTPISQTCQKNFVMLATDGNPTGRTNGNQYNPSEWQNTLAGGVWTYGQAQRDVFDQLTALRAITVGGRNYDVQTYVVGMGDSLANPSSIAALNRMADLGGGYPTAFVGSSTESLQRAFQDIVGDIQAKTSAASSVA